MSRRNEILETVLDLTKETGKLPSLQGTAHAAGLTKQGVLHHFPSRAALDRAVVLHALAEVDHHMRRAAQEGSPLETYLRLSSPTDHDRAAALVVGAAARDGSVDLPPEVGEAIQRWQRMIAEETGNEVLAEVVRLTGDGLFVEALVSGSAPPAERIDALVAHFRHGVEGFGS